MSNSTINIMTSLDTKQSEQVKQDVFKESLTASNTQCDSPAFVDNRTNLADITKMCLDNAIPRKDKNDLTPGS